MHTTVNQNNPLNVTSNILLTNQPKEQGVLTENNDCIIVHVESVTVEISRSPKKTLLTKPKNMIHFIAQAIFKKQKASLVTLLLLAVLSVNVGWGQTTRYWKGTGTWTSANQWATTSGGTYNTTWVSNDVAVFDVASSTVTFASSGVTGITANQNVTFTAAGTLSTNGTNIPVLVASGMTLNLAGQAISTAVGTGFSKNGLGTLIITSGGAYPGGFTLNNGTMQVGGVNALGTGGALTLNGGVLTVNSATARDFTAKFNTGGIIIGGNFQLGDAVNVSAGTGNLTFSNATSLGAATRTITIGGAGTYTLGGVISGSAGSGLIINTTSTGNITLTAANTYTGNTTINGNLILNTGGSIASSPIITVGSGGTFNVSGLTTALSLGASQSLKSSATGSNTTATITVASSKGITLSAGGLEFTAYGGGATAPLTVNGAAASLALASAPITITTTTALAAGTYKLIAIGGSVTAAVSGTIGTLTMAGSGLASNTTGALSIVNGELILTVTATPTLTAATLSSAISNVYGTASTGVSFTASGSNLTGNITATAQTGFAVSTTLGSGYGSSVSVASGTTVYVQSTATKAVSTFNTATAVVLSGGGAASSVNITTSASGNAVTQKALTISSAAATSKTYDRTTTATITGSLSGVVNSDVVTLSGAGTFAQSNIGTAISVTSTSTLGGAGAANYSLTQPTGLTANITAKTLTVSGASASNKTYDGTNTATVTGGSLVGIVSPDAVSLSQSGTFSQTTIGTTLSVTSTSTIGGADAGNYTLTQPTGLTANITAKALTISGMTASDKTYEGTTTATLSGGSLVGVVSPDVVTLTQTGTFSQSNAGNGLTISSTSTLGGADAGNYSLTQPSGITASITKATPVINSSPSASDITLGQALSSSTLTSGSATPSGGSFAFTSPSTVPGSTGSYSASVTYSPTDGTNYNTVSGTTNVNVNAALTPTLNSVTLSSNLTSTYGTASSGISFSPSGSNLSGNITVTAQSGFEVSTSSGSGYGASVSVASGSTVYVSFSSTMNAGIYSNTVFAVISSAGASNLNATTSSTGNIVSPKALSISPATIASKSYDGSNACGTISQGTLTGFVGSETVTISNVTGTYSDANVGTGKTATIIYTLANGSNGGLAINYALANTNETGDITSKTLSISAATIASKVYDASSSTGTITAGTLSGFVGSETVSLSTVTGIYSDANVGTGKTATISYTLANGSNGGLATNYTLSNTSSTGNITAKSLSISAASIASKTYDASATSGTVTPGTLSGFVGSETVTVSAAVGTYADGNVGTGKSATIVYTLANGINGGLATNYTLANTVGTGNITGKALTIVGATAQNKSYDGTTTAIISGGTLSGIESGDVVTLSQLGTFATSNAGTGIAVTSTSTIGGASSANYSLTQPNGLTADITAANLTITANNVSKNSGVALSGGAGSTAFTSSGLQNGQTIGSVTISYGSAGSATGDGITPGIYSSQVTPSLATGGTFNSANYSISYVAGSITVISAPIAIAIQDFETVPATPTLGYQSNAAGSLISGASGTGDRPASSNYFISSNTAWNANNTSSILTFSNVTGLGSYISKYYEFRLASYSNASTGNGADATDIATVEVSLDGGTNWSSELRVLGNSNAYWSYSATGLASITYDGNNTPTDFQPAGGGSRTTDGYSTIKINLSDLSVQARLRITLLNNATGERWVIDDVKLIGTINTLPTILISSTSLTGFSQNSSTPSSEQSYTVSGDNLTNDVTITPPAGYEISTSTGGSFSATNPITLSASGGNLVGEPVTIYVRQSASTLGVISGNITHSSTGANSPNVAVSGTRTGSYYSKATGNLDDINSWGSNTDGSGSNPSNFSTDGIIYEIRNRTNATIGANWTVTGTASKVLVGDGTNSTDFTIPSGFVLTGTVDVSNSAELTLENTTAPTFGTFATNSTLEYKDLPITLSTSTTYKNLKLTGSGTKTFPGGTTNVTGNLIFTNTTIDGGSGPFSTISLSGDLTYVGTVTPPADANSITLSTNGTAGGTQTITGAGNTLRWFRIQSTTANTILLSTNGGSGNLHVGNSSGGGITLVDGSILNINGNDFTLFSSVGTSSAFLLNNTASISTTSATDLTIERTGNGNLGTIRFTSGSNTIGNLTLKHVGSSNNLLTLGSALSINGTLTLTTGVLSIGANTLSLNGNLNRTSGFIDASNAAATIVFGGSSSQNIPASTFSGNIANLTLNNGSGLSTGQNLTIASGLSLTSGTLTVGANTLTLNGSINQTTGNIDASNATSTVVFGGSTAQSIPASTFTGNINNLTLSNSAGLSISQDLSVVGTLTLSSGKLTLGTNHLTLGESATTSGTFSSNNMIIATGLGELRKRFTQGSGDIASFTFPVGNIGGVAEYTPIVLDFASGNYGANAYVSVRVQDSKQATLNSSVTNYLNRNWIVEPNDITGYSYKIQLHYVDADFVTDGSMAEGDLKPIKISSGQWYQPTDGSFTNAVSQGSAGVFANSNYLEWNGLTTFSEFGGAGGSNQPLPVELLSFTAECGKETIILKWQTASEFNSAYFEIQKSLDGSTWNTIGSQTAAGNSNELLSYSFEDASKSANTSYYRLNQVDNDGLQKFYGPISPLCESIIHLNGKTIPNPSNNEFWLQISSAEQQKFTYILQDVNGSKIMENKAELLPGSNMFPIRETIPSGMYFIVVQTENGQQEVIKHIRN